MASDGAFVRRSIHPLWWLAGAALALRLLAFLGRGDHVAFDEGWYLLLGVNLTTGKGFTLSGLQHIALSPLYPLAAGALNLLIDHPVWSGRLVAAVTAGLLVIPCWSIFRRLTGRKTATLACGFIAVMPSLAPFVAPYWIGWDLWVGAEPLFHLLLFTGLALSLRASDRERLTDWVLAGVVFALAYLTRPEAIIAFGTIGIMLAGHAVWSRQPHRLVHAAVLGLAFAVTAAPYWVYLHDVMGRWAITGRGVEVTLPRPAMRTGASSTTPSGSATIEQMLWNRDQSRYVKNLYSLDASGTRLASTYWGVRRDTARTSETPASSPEISLRAEPPEPPAARPGDPASRQSQSRIVLYVRALTRVIPVSLWPIVLLGVVASRRAWRTELIVILPLVVTSIAIARVVGIDPRTQLFLAPVAAFYVARGVRRIGLLVDRRLRGTAIRRGFTAATLATVALLLLLGTQARRLYMSIAVGSRHQVVGQANRRVGEALNRSLPSDATVTSWHPAIALYARRDWRVLPRAPFRDIVRYADAADARYLVLSPYYPAPQLLDPTAREHIVIYVPVVSRTVQHWNLDLQRTDAAYVTGTLRPATVPTAGGR
jgi:4-amino-4-deoxy-L-arabinose transferase-like glycosyltransferase